VFTKNTPLFRIPEYFAVDIGNCVSLKSQKSIPFRIIGEHQDCDYIVKAYDAEPKPLPCSKIDITKRLALSYAPYICISHIFQNVSRQTERENTEFIETVKCLSTIRNFFQPYAFGRLYCTCVLLVMLVLHAFGKLQPTSKRTAPKISRNNNIMVETISST